MKRIIIIIVLFSGFQLLAQIPENRIVDWSVAGLKENIAEPSIQLDVTDYGLVGDSLTDNYAAFQTALSILGESPGVLFFPEGKYSFKTGIQIPQDVILRGEGAYKTKLFFDLNDNPNHCIVISESHNNPFVEVYKGFEKGCDTLILKSQLSFNDGGMAELRQDNGIWDSDPADWATKVVGQILHVESQNGDTLFLEYPLRLDYDTSLNLEVRKINPIKNVALECFYIERLDEPSSAGSNIYFNYAANCKVSGVESNVSSGAHIYVNSSTNILVEGSYIHHSINYDGVGTNGYGVMLNNHSGECLIENNIFQFLRHAMMVKTGSNGNVFAYNYSIEPNRSETFSTLSGDISLHGHYAFANLFEGNVIQNIILDHFWGPSGPNNTFFRNRAELYGIIFYDDGSILSNEQNIIGNEVSNSISPYGQYLLFGSNHFEYANNVKGSNVPVSTDDLSISSLFYDSQPEYWNESLGWPPIGYPNTLNQYKIPAQLRNENEEAKTICPENQTGVSENYFTNSLCIYPLPFTDYLSIDLGSEIDEILFIEVFNLSGVNVFSWKSLSNNGKLILDHELSHLNAGVYILSIRVGNNFYSQKIIKK